MTSSSPAASLRAKSFHVCTFSLSKANRAAIPMLYATEAVKALAPSMKKYFKALYVSKTSNTSFSILWDLSTSTTKEHTNRIASEMIKYLLSFFNISISLEVLMVW